MRGANHEVEKGVINYSSIPFLIHFKGLYLMGEGEATNALSGIPIALSSNRELIRKHQQS